MPGPYLFCCIIEVSLATQALPNAALLWHRTVGGGSALYMEDSMLFEFDTQSPLSPYIDLIWQMESEQAESFLSTAATNWEMVFY